MISDIESEQNFQANQLAVNETILKTIKTMGVTQEVVKLVESTVDASHERVRSINELNELFEGFSSQDYVAAHSTILAHIGGFLLSKLSWTKEEDYENLALAALLHDVAVASDQLAHVQSREQMHLLIGQYTKQELEDYMNHPVLASDITKFITQTDFPSEVEMMIHQHHERPDGSGFPNGLSYDAITVESAVFILSHEIVNLLTKKWVNISFPFLLKYLSKRFSGGAFDKVLGELTEST